MILSPYGKISDMSKVRIQPVRVKHLPALERQFRRAAHGSFSYLPPNDMRDIIHQNRLSQLTIGKFHPNRIVLTAHRDGDLLGYAIGSVEKGSANLYWLYVEPELRGQNLGLKLLSSLRKEAQRKGAKELVLATYDHQKFYARQGFQLVDERHLHGVDMKIMKLVFGHEE